MTKCEKCGMMVHSDFDSIRQHVRGCNKKPVEKKHETDLADVVIGVGLGIVADAILGSGSDSSPSQSDSGSSFDGGGGGFGGGGSDGSW